MPWSPENNTSDGWTSAGYARADTKSHVESEATQSWRDCSPGGDESAGASVDGPPVCSLKAIVVQSGDHPEAAAGSIQITPLHTQRAMASAEAPPPSMLQAVPAQLANHLEGDPKAQALSYQLSSLDKNLEFLFFTEERRSWVMSLPTESGEKVLKALCVSGLHVEADLASRLQTLCKRRWYVLARFLAAKTAPVQFCISSASGGLGVSADSPAPEELEEIPS